uniref:SPT2 chromatin protein n=1 Tax=Kalanchoe fedtschenkoi TaxID=63787 RepID=A0A7N0URY2_KALFE
MREYEDYEDMDEYEEDGYYEEDGDAGEEEYEQEKEPKLTQEQLKYLELRKLKESYRKQLTKETGSAPANSLDRSRKDNFGSFFGPSQPVIAPRVIQESKSLLENQHLASRILNPTLSKKPVNQTSSGIRPRPSSMPKVDPVKVKVQKLKDTRDYSFLLSDDAVPPAPRKEPPLRKVSAPNIDSRSSQRAEKSRQPLSNESRQVPGGNRQVPMGREERKPVSMNTKLQQPGDPKATSSIRQNPALADSRKQHVSNGRPVQDRSLESKRQLVHSNTNRPERPNEPKNIPSKNPNGIMRKTSGVPVTKSSMLSLQKPTPKANSQPAKKALPQKKVLQDHFRSNMAARQPATSVKPQINRLISKPVKPISSQSFVQERPKKRPLSRPLDDEDDDGFDYRSAIRNMFRYNPNKFQDDDDTSDMEAGFDEILKEERRSALIAKKEDEIEQRLIEEEERRERMRKAAKRRKLSQR